MQVVVDTNVWVKSKEDIYCNRFLSNLAFSNDSLVLDYENVMLAEYKDEVKDIYSEMYYSKISEEKRIAWVSSKLDSKYKEKLAELGFHEEEDQAFVGAAMNADKCIAENSDTDYGIFPKENYRSEEEYQTKKAVAEYMKNTMKLKVKTPEDIVENGWV